jgi:hypothetical protein
MTKLVSYGRKLIILMWKTDWRVINRLEVRQNKSLSLEIIATIPREMTKGSQKERCEIHFLLLQPSMGSSMPTSKVLPCTKENEWPGTCWPWAKILTYTLSTSMQRASFFG